MNDEDFKPGSIVLGADQATTLQSAPALTGTTAILTGQETMPAESQENYNFITGPDGQTYAVKDTPFVWKKFFIGLGVPLFLMIVPIILASMATVMDDNMWDDQYTDSRVDLERENNGTQYSGYIAENFDEIGGCSFFNTDYWSDSRPNSSYYECDQYVREDRFADGGGWTADYLIYRQTNILETMTRGEGTNYSAQYEIFEGEIETCYIFPDDASKNEYVEYWCAPIYQDTNDVIYGRNQSGHMSYVGQIWRNNHTINFDDGTDYGSDIEIRVYIYELVGSIDYQTGQVQYDDGEWDGDSLTFYVETHNWDYDDEQQDRIETLYGASVVLCLLAPLVGIIFIIYGFAAGGKAMGIGASVSLVLYPFVAFFGCIAALSGGF